MSIKLLFADPNLLHLERAFSEPDRITIIVETKSKQALCPQYHSPSAQTRSIKLNNASGLVGVWLVVNVHHLLGFFSGPPPALGYDFFSSLISSLI
jgi:hypothetical protein